MQNQIMPRFDLREPAFRKYETFIAQACYQHEFKVNPMMRLRVSPATFVARFRDALLAYKTYGYHSDAIPKGAVLSGIKAFELVGGVDVLIKNETMCTAQAQVQNSTAAEQLVLT